jgi:hypothetical protein
MIYFLLYYYSYSNYTFNLIYMALVFFNGPVVWGILRSFISRLSEAKVNQCLGML